MCGIIGLINDTTWNNTDSYWHAGKEYHYLSEREKFIKQALLVDSVRGEDATGLACISEKGEVSSYKKAIAGYDFLQLNSTQRLLNMVDSAQYVIGHNRWATVGNSSDSRKAQPFTEDHITLVHNGTLTSWKDLTPHNVSAQTDSHAIAYSIANEGVEDTVKELVGAFALVWHDSTDNSINFIRNKERPFCIMSTTNDILFGSELGMIKWLAQRNGYKINTTANTKEGQYCKMIGKEVVEDKVLPLYTPKYTNKSIFSNKSPTVTNKNSSTGETREWASRSSIANYLKNNSEIKSLNERVLFCLKNKNEMTMNPARKDHILVEGELCANTDVMIRGSIHIDEYDGEDNSIYSGDIRTSMSEWVRKSSTKFTDLSLYVDNIKLELELELSSEYEEKEDTNVIELPCSDDDEAVVTNCAGPGGKAVTKLKWLELTANGCGVCGNVIAESEAPHTRYTINNETPVCRSCDESHYAYSGLPVNIGLDLPSIGPWITKIVVGKEK